ncbi:type II toxin-antitoxin system VapC family toxin [Pelomicrobium methylotrophicum]|uniref:Type II toxin-antitoxin system VapC family toxin n=1 Tax=Pelomicrobium methylotrophicum TaxID=2602750 RepID=A0A5C7EFW9_9PROT|nr:type II toxin-antitoxin system VapC family toxin [Pelomicrobium methylotrophicum]
MLDTHVALWAIADHPRLPPDARELILSPKVNVWVSAATVWEIAIKRSLARGDMPISAQEALAYFKAAGYRFLPVDEEHAAAVEDLPHHHGDPFDRILVAQALVEPMRLLTSDEKVARYSNTFLKI